MKNLKKLKSMYLFILVWPLLDFLSLFFPTTQFVITIIKCFFLLYAIFSLLKNTEHKKALAFLGVYFIIYSCYLIKEHLSFFINIQNSLTIFSLPILILFFENYKNDKINKKSITMVSILYFCFALLSFCLFKDFENLYPLCLILISVDFLYIKESNNYLLKGFYFVLVILLALLLNSSSFYISFLLIFLVSLILNFKKNYFISLLTLFVFLFTITVYIHPIEFNSPIFSLENTPVLKENLNNLERVHKNFKESSSLEKVFGLETQEVKTNIDVFAILYSMGILGVSFYVIFFVFVLNKCKLSKKYNCFFFSFLFLSCFLNILTNFYVIPYLALFFLLSKNDKGVIKKDILFVSNMYPSNKYPHYGVFVKNTYEVLKQDGFSLDLVVMHKTSAKVRKLFAYIKLCGISFLKALFNNYDFIYVHFISHTTVGVFLPALCSKSTKLVLNVHGNDLVPDTKTDQNYLFLSKFFLKYADIVISPSKYFAQVLRKEYKIPKENIVVYPSGGVDTEKFKRINKKTALKESGLDSKYKYFGFIARIEKDKGYDIFVKAIHELDKKKINKEIKFLMVGSGKEEDNLNTLIKKYKLESRIIRKPLVSQEELVEIYNSLEAFVYPTRMQSESLGLVGLEAMACEVLVIGSNKFGPSDYLIDNENSLTFNPNDYKKLASKIEQVLNMSTKEKNKLTKNARKKSMEYSSENIKTIILEVFKKS